MRKKLFPFLIGFLVIVAFTFANGADSYAMMYKFSGGPSGGTYQYFSSAIATLSKKADMKVLSSSSGGSIENIRLVNTGRSSFGISYAGDIYHARNGLLKQDDRKYTDVLAVAYFYSAPAQLVVRADSGITSAKQLEGKRVGVGNAGSGAAATCELFFTALGIWDKIDKNFLGYRQAAEAFKNKQLEAFWIFAGFPNSSIIEAAVQNKITLVDIYKDAESVNMFEKYPYFNKVVIPANTYEGVAESTNTFQDATVWTANAKVSADDVYALLKVVFSPEGLKYMVDAHKAAKAMSVEKGLNGIDPKVIPVHPGAEKFWKEKGIIK